MPDTYRSQHTGTIADLMRQRGRIDADSVRSSGNASAQARAASGQAWGQAVQNIGQQVGGTLADIAQHRADAPNRQLRQRQSDLIAEQLSGLETTAAQTKIGELAQMVKASGYDPTAAQPLFEAIGKLSPDYAEPLMLSLQNPEMLKRVTETLITQTPGYKAPEGFSLSEGQTRFGPNGEQIANVPKAAPVPPAPQPFTLTPGAKRYNPDGSVVAEVPANAPQAANPTEASLALEAAGGDPAKALALIRAQRPASTSGGARPLTQTAEAALITRLAKDWATQTKPTRELERQVRIMDVGMEAVRRGDMSQGAQQVLVTFQKILDPPSVVRDSEFWRSANGQSLRNRIQGAMDKLTKGGVGVTADELQKFAELARQTAKAQGGTYLDRVKTRIGKTADRYDIPHELIFEAPEVTEVDAGAVEEWGRDANGKLIQKKGGG